MNESDLKILTDAAKRIADTLEEMLPLVQKMADNSEAKYQVQMEEFVLLKAFSEDVNAAVR